MKAKRLTRRGEPTGLKAGVNRSAADSPVEWLNNVACDLFRETKIDFRPGLRKLRPAKGMQHVTAFSPPKLSRLRRPSRESELVDSGRLARPDSLRLHSACDPADLLSGTGALEPGGHLSFCRCFRRDGPPFAGDDSRLRRSRVIPALQERFIFTPIFLFSSAPLFSCGISRALCWSLLSGAFGTA